MQTLLTAGCSFTKDNYQMKINFTIRKDGIGFQIIDSWYGLLQSLMPDYTPPVDIHFNAPYSSKDFNVLCDYMPSRYSEQELANYNLIFFCNGGEPLHVATETMGNLINQQNVYLITNSYIEQSHPLHHKVIRWGDDVQTCRDYWTRHFYPQYYENIKNRSIDRTAKLIAIAGSVRTHRYYFFELLKKQIPSMLQLSNISTTIHKLNDAHWETLEDTQFREWVNNQYHTQSIPQPDQYYNNNVNIGIDNKFGEIPPGYFIMPEYFKYACVIFPETSWQNNELSVTEKSLKCFYAGSLPFPISGANVNQFYNNIGFYTAWNLLPDDLKLFDQITDHKIRYDKAVEAVKWLDDNRSVFEGEQFKYMVDQNRANFLTNECDNNSTIQFHTIMKSKLSIDIGSKI